MKKLIRIVKSTICDRLKVRPGDYLEVNEDEARTLVLMKKAIYADDEVEQVSADENPPAEDAEPSAGKRGRKKRG